MKIGIITAMSSEQKQQANLLENPTEPKEGTFNYTKRTIKKAVAVTSVETATEALALSLNERAKVDLSYMAQLTGKTEEKITEELVGVIFKNPLTDQ